MTEGINNKEMETDDDNVNDEDNTDNSKTDLTYSKWVMVMMMTTIKKNRTRNNEGKDNNKVAMRTSMIRMLWIMNLKIELIALYHIIVLYHLYHYFYISV